MGKSRPNFWTILGLVLAIIGIYLSYITIKEREPTLIVEKATLLIDNNSIKGNPIKIVDSENKEVKENISLFTFYFFNQGNESIKKENVLKPIKIKLPVDGKLLNLKVLKASRDVSEIQLKYDSLSKSILVDFKILEFEDGISAQILFAGTANPTISIEGIIEGVRDFEYSYSTSVQKFIKVGFIIAVLINGSLFSIFLYVGLTKYRLTKKYDLIIRNTNNHAEASIIQFTYLKVILTSAILFLCMFAFALFLSTTIINKRNNPTVNAPQSIKVF